MNLGIVDGKQVSIQQTIDPLKKKRPPLFAILLVDNKPVAIKSYDYEKHGSTWRPRRITTAGLDSLGRANSVTTLELGTASGLAANRTLRSRLRGFADLAGNSLIQLVQPDALHAATDECLEDDESLCFNEKMAVAIAVVGQAAAFSAYLLAVASCAASPATCVLAVTAAHLAWLTADYALAVAIVNLQKCLCPPPAPVPPPTPPTYGSTGGGGGNYECSQIDWWVSYDDGITWSW